MSGRAARQALAGPFNRSVHYTRQAPEPGQSPAAGAGRDPPSSRLQQLRQTIAGLLHPERVEADVRQGMNSSERPSLGASRMRPPLANVITPVACFIPGHPLVQL